MERRELNMEVSGVEESDNEFFGDFGCFAEGVLSGRPLIREIKRVRSEVVEARVTRGR